MKKIIIMLLSFLLFGCGVSEEIVNQIDLPVDKPELISTIKIPSTPFDIKSKESFYGTIKIVSFKITNYNTYNSSDSIKIDYEIESYSDNKRADYIAFYFVFYDKEGYRIGDRWFMENAGKSEKIRIKDHMYIPKATVEIKILPAE